MFPCSQTHRPKHKHTPIQMHPNIYSYTAYISIIILFTLILVILKYIVKQSFCRLTVRNNFVCLCQPVWDFSQEMKWVTQTVVSSLWSCLVLVLISLAAAFYTDSVSLLVDFVVNYWSKWQNVTSAECSFSVWVSLCCKIKTARRFISSVSDCLRERELNFSFIILSRQAPSEDQKWTTMMSHIVAVWKCWASIHISSYSLKFINNSLYMKFFFLR